MRILHLMLSCFYIDNWAYQENILPRQNKKDGHEVLIITSTETYLNPSELGYVTPGHYKNEDGIEIFRIPYNIFIPHFIARKIRSYPKVYEMISAFKPDVILFHGACAYELLTVAKYKKEHPSVKFYVDSHEDYFNSARSTISKEILHRRFYGPILRKVLPYVDKILCVSLGAIEFLNSLYDIPKDKMEFFPLGGDIIPESDRQKKREKIRRENGIEDSVKVFVHSGKMKARKRTVELLDAFSSIPSRGCRLYLIGDISDEIREEVEKIIKKDDRIFYLGWKDNDELVDYLCASDLYLQPGSQSATMQNALCCGCPVMLFPYKSHIPYLKNNGFFVRTKEDMKNVFAKISEYPSCLESMPRESYKVSRELLDYKKLAMRLYS